jgi:hypothetical protein
MDLPSSIIAIIAICHLPSSAIPHIPPHPNSQTNPVFHKSPREFPIPYSIFARARRMRSLAIGYWLLAIGNWQRRLPASTHVHAPALAWAVGGSSLPPGSTWALLPFAQVLVLSARSLPH